MRTSPWVGKLGLLVKELKEWRYAFTVVFRQTAHVCLQMNVTFTHSAWKRNQNKYQGLQKFLIVVIFYTGDTQKSRESLETPLFSIPRSRANCSQSGSNGPLRSFNSLLRTPQTVWTSLADALFRGCTPVNIEEKQRNGQIQELEINSSYKGTLYLNAWDWGPEKNWGMIQSPTKVCPAPRSAAGAGSQRPSADHGAGHTVGSRSEMMSLRSANSVRQRLVV